MFHAVRNSHWKIKRVDIAGYNTTACRLTTLYITLSNVTLRNLPACFVLKYNPLRSPYTHTHTHMLAGVARTSESSI